MTKSIVPIFITFYDNCSCSTETISPVKNRQGNAYTLSRPLYFAGESYAGHYIPTIVDYILQQNQNVNDKNENGLVPSIHDIAGAAIGNGYMDPNTQWNNAVVEYGFGLVDLSQKAFSMQKKWNVTN